MKWGLLPNIESSSNRSTICCVMVMKRWCTAYSWSGNLLPAVVLHRGDLACCTLQEWVAD